MRPPVSSLTREERAALVRKRAALLAQGVSHAQVTERLGYSSAGLKKMAARVAREAQDAQREAPHAE